MEFPPLEGDISEIQEAEARRSLYVEKWRNHYRVIKKHELCKRDHLERVEAIIAHVAKIERAEVWLEITLERIMPPAPEIARLDPKLYEMVKDCHRSWFKILGIK